MISLEKIENFNKKFDVVSIFIVHGDKILLLKRQVKKPFAGKWGPPTGKVDIGESLEEAMCRETFEETGISLVTDDITKYERHYFVRHGDLDFMFHVYSVEVKNGLDVCLRDIEHCGYEWFTPEEALELDLVEDEEVPIRDFFIDN